MGSKCASMTRAAMPQGGPEPPSLRAPWRGFARRREQLQYPTMRTPVEVSEECGVRYLHFGSSWVQGAMRIARPWALELDYTREMMAGLLLRPGPEWPKTVLLIGLGAASMTKFLYRHRPRAKLTVVEISPDVVAAARQCFKLPQDPGRLKIEVADGVDFVAASRRRFDLILVDGFDADARAGALNSVPFYQLCRGRLSDRGLLAVNLLRRNRADRVGIEGLRAAFDGRAFAFPPTRGGNTIAFAAEGRPIRISFAQLMQSAATLKSSTRLDLLPALERLMRGGAGDGLDL
jgi:spermidine synthase